MAASTNPIFPNVPVLTWGTVTTANTAMDGTGTVVTVFTAGAAGSRIGGIKVKSLGTNIQTVLRIFINNGSPNTTAANNTLYGEYTIAQTAASANTSLTEYYIPLIQAYPNTQLALPIGYKINVTIGTTVAAGLQITCDGGNY